MSPTAEARPSEKATRRATESGLPAWPTGVSTAPGPCEPRPLPPCLCLALSLAVGHFLTLGAATCALLCTQQPHTPLCLDSRTPGACLSPHFSPVPSRSGLLGLLRPSPCTPSTFFQGSGLGSYGVHTVRFPSLRDHCPWTLKTLVSSYFVCALVASGRSIDWFQVPHLGPEWKPIRPRWVLFSTPLPTPFHPSPSTCSICAALSPLPRGRDDGPSRAA